MHVSWAAALAVALAFAGCFGPDGVLGPGNQEYHPAVPREPLQAKAGPANDTDADGILDDLERALAAGPCTIGERSCAELGVTPPQVGVRDFVIVNINKSTDYLPYRLPPHIVADFLVEMTSMGVAAQYVWYGEWDALDPEATWDDPDNAESFWHAWLTYGDDPESGDAGQALLNWVRMLDLDTDGSKRMSLLHEVYHLMLGDLSG